MKGFWGLAILMIILFFILILVAWSAGSLIGRTYPVKRYLFEASLISESDKVETYVRSFQRATDLSILQSVYDSGRGSIVLPYEFTNPYSEKYLLPYWKIYDETYIPPEDVLKDILKQKISWDGSCYIKNYYDSFKGFSSSEFKMKFSSFPFLRVKEINDDEVKVKGDSMSVERNDTVQGQSIKINREFIPYSSLEVNLGRMIRIVEDIVSSDELKKCVTNESQVCYRNDLGNLQPYLNELTKNWNERDIKVEFKIINPREDIEVKNNRISATINVRIYDNRTNYTLFPLQDCNIKLDFLGFNFLMRVGNLINLTGIKRVNALPNFYECSSRFGIVSEKNLCNFYTIEPSSCSDSDGMNFITKGNCEDFTGYYEDKCTDDSTLYEYDCFPLYGICKPIKHVCTNGCENGACKVICRSDEECDDNDDCTEDKCINPGTEASYCEHEFICECRVDADCDDGNPCTGVEEDGGIDKCINGVCYRPFLPKGYIPSGNSCGINTKDCSQKCEDGIEYRDSTGQQVCARTCDGNGNCMDCTPPDCSYNVIKTCNYGCKDSTRCWYGYWCPEKTCSSSDSSGICQGTSECTTEAKCIAEYQSKPSCSYFDGAYRWCWPPSSPLGCASLCSWCCCWNSEETCVADCSLNETCTYS